eukprot:761971-Hanusia_phi.AAC.5
MRSISASDIAVRSEDEALEVLTTGGTHLASALKRLALPWRATKFSSVVPSRVVRTLESSSARLRFSGDARGRGISKRVGGEEEEIC